MKTSPLAFLFLLVFSTVQAGSKEPEALLEVEKRGVSSALELAVEVAEDTPGARKLKHGEGEIVVTPKPAIAVKSLLSANAVREPSGWSVMVTLSQGDAKAFFDLTTKLAGKPERIAVILDGKVLTAPVVHEPVPGGAVRITGDFTAVEAKLLAKRLKAAAP